MSLLPDVKPVLSCKIDNFETRYELGDRDPGKQKEGACRAMVAIMEAMKKGMPTNERCQCTVKDANLIHDGLPLTAGLIEWINPEKNVGQVVFANAKRRK